MAKFYIIVMDYKPTVNLPQTGFSMKANLIQKEPLWHKQWEDVQLYAQIRRRRKNQPKFILHDGPPYPTGSAHLGQGLNRMLKDLVVRFKTMQGFDSPFVPGWDCHGLPIEHKILQELGEKAKTLSVLEIREHCRDYAQKYVDVQRSQFKRLGTLGDWDHPYTTFDPHYESAVLEVFRKLVQKGYVYRQLKPVSWCAQCETALAEAELEYKETSSSSIYVSFPVLRTERSARFFEAAQKIQTLNLLIWTTTPWTLPANLAVAVHPDLDYVTVRSGEEYFILAKDRLNVLQSELGWDRVEVLQTCKGKALTALEYAHWLFPEKHCPVITATYVSKEDGTGCVHTAPGHGQEDYESGIQNGLDIFSPVSASGQFTAEVKSLEGISIDEANPLLCDRLQAMGRLIKKGTISHSYPHCWRCKQPTLFRSTEQWFIDIDREEARQKVLSLIEQAQWIPPWGKTRIRSMVEKRPHWCISRQRSWGVPIPAFFCRSCGQAILDPYLIENVQKIFHEEGSDSWFIRPAEYFLGGQNVSPANELLPSGFAAPLALKSGLQCPRCETVNAWEKGNDIFDVWFEAGSSWNAVLRRHPELAYPCDLYLEGSDQHRGWFQLSLIPSALTHNVAPYRAVLTHGFFVTEEGEKLSKSQRTGELFKLDSLIERFGADVLRLWITSVDFTDDIPTSLGLFEKGAEVYKKIRNTFRYLLGNLYDYPRSTVNGRPPTANRQLSTADGLWLMDKVMLDKLQRLIEKVTHHFEACEFHRVYTLLYEFCAVDLSALYFDMIKDRLYTYGKNSPDRRAAQFVLQQVLDGLIRLWSPILVYTMEEVWQTFYAESPGHPGPSAEGLLGRLCTESIHLQDWPTVKKEWMDEMLEKKWKHLLAVREETYKQVEKLRADKTLGSALEVEVTIRVDQESPLANILQSIGSRELASFLIVSKADWNVQAQATTDGRLPTANVLPTQVGIQGQPPLEKQKEVQPQAAVEMVSPFEVAPLEVAPPSESKLSFSVNVVKTQQPKCARCWMHTDSVGHHPTYPDLCAKCVTALGSTE